MPIIKSAKKRMRQNETARVRNQSQNSRMRSLYKNIIKWAEAGESEKAEKYFDDAQKAIDTCAKKNIIHPNNAARKKSRIAKLVSGLKQKKTAAQPQQTRKTAEPELAANATKEEEAKQES